MTIVANTTPIRIGPNTRVVLFADGEQWEVPIRELDRETRDQLRLILEVLDTEEQA